MDNKYRNFYSLTDEQIEELDLDELARIAGGGDRDNSVKCPICKQKYPIREIKDHIKQCKKNK